MRIAHAPSQLERRPRAAAIGTFDGVHRGHRSVLRTVVGSGLEPTVITLDPHPRIVLGNRVELLTTLGRRLELLAEAGIADTLVAAFTPEFMRLTPEEFVDRYLRSIGAEAVAVGADFRFGNKRAGSVETLRELGLTVLEAMSHGLPVVAAKGGGHLETIAAVAPELCYPVGDLSTGAEILRLLAEDEGRRGQLGGQLQAAQRAQFSLLAQACATEDVYRSVL